MIILISLFFFNFTQAQSIPFKINETLTYKAFFSGLPAGKGELTVIKLDTIQLIMFALRLGQQDLQISCFLLMIK